MPTTASTWRDASFLGALYAEQTRHWRSQFPRAVNISPLGQRR